MISALQLDFRHKKAGKLKIVGGEFIRLRTGANAKCRTIIQATEVAPVRFLVAGKHA